MDTRLQVTSGCVRFITAHQVTRMVTFLRVDLDPVRTVTETTQVPFLTVRSDEPATRHTPLLFALTLRDTREPVDTFSDDARARLAAVRDFRAFEETSRLAGRIFVRITGDEWVYPTAEKESQPFVSATDVVAVLVSPATSITSTEAVSGTFGRL